MQYFNQDEYNMVREFHIAFGHPAPEKFTRISKGRVMKRIDWILDEIVEFNNANTAHEILNEAVDVKYFCYGTLVESGYHMIGKKRSRLCASMIRIIDKYHKLTAWKINYTENDLYHSVHDRLMSEVFEIVHNSNMQKLHNGKPIYREDGKIIKPEGWQPPKQAILDLIQSFQIPFTNQI